ALSSKRFLVLPPLSQTLEPSLLFVFFFTLSLPFLFIAWDFPSRFRPQELLRAIWIHGTRTWRELSGTLPCFLLKQFSRATTSSKIRMRRIGIVQTTPTYVVEDPIDGRTIGRRQATPLC
ncbi:unnamed protein product, partial [Musa acuminata subsp. burmannicoides]